MDYQSIRTSLSTITLDETKALVSRHYREQSHENGVFLVGFFLFLFFPGIILKITFSYLRKIPQDAVVDLRRP